MEVIYQNDVRKAFKIFQAFGVFGEYLNYSVNSFSGCGLYRYSFWLFEWGMNDSYWLILYLANNFISL